MGKSLQFGDFRLDLARFCLLGPSGPIDLRPKSFEVLRYLVEHSERIVPRDEVIKAIWPNVIVTEDSLTHCISEVRRAIGDDAQALIKTVPKRGYMLDAPVIAADAVAARSQSPSISGSDRGASQETIAPLLEAGARKQATVLYVEIGKILGQVADRDSEGTLEIYEATLVALAGAIQRYGGTVTSISEDAVVGLFGVPLALEDHAVRACHAATDIQLTAGRSLSGIADVAPQAPSISIGIAAGEIIARPLAGIRDRTELGVAGPAIRQATRLGRAANGSTLISREVSLLAQGYVQVKSPCAAIAEVCGGLVCELIGMAPSQTRFQAVAARGLTPFVGRTSEIEHIEQAAAKAYRGHGQVVAVIGDPGVGKSRLIHEFMRNVHGTSWLALSAGAISHRAPTSCQPLADLLKAYFQIVASDDAAIRHAKVVGKLETTDGSLTADLPAHLTLIDEPVDDPAWQALVPAARRERIFDALKRLLLREALNQPIILALEDLHWIDSETQAFLDGLVDSLALARVLVLVTYRPHYEHRWGGKSFYTQVRLEELAPDRCGELLCHLVGNDASLADIKQSLQTQGNPLFLEESVRSLAEERVLEGQRGCYRLARPLGDLPVPAAIQAILAARIDRLATRQRHLLQAAAVIGKDGTIDILRQISRLPDGEFELGLAGLQNAELVFQADFSADRSFTFKHALTHEVAYGSLLADQRRHFHKQIVAAIERLSSDRRTEHVEQLAHHAVRGDLGEKAVQYLWEAGGKAFARSSNREAVAYYEQALTVLARLAETRTTREQAIDIRCDLRSALYSLAEHGRIEKHLLEAESLARELGDQSRLGWVSAYMSSLYLTTGGHANAARASAQRADVIAEELGESRLHVAAQYYLAWASYISGDYFRTERICRDMMASLEGDRKRELFGVVIPAVQSRVYLARALAERGDFGEGDAQGREAIRLAEELEHPFSLSWACLGLAHVKSVQGELGQAGQLLERAIAQCRQLKIGAYLPLVMALLGHVHARSGRVQEGVTLLQQAVADYESMGMEHFLSISVVQQGEAYLLAGQTDSARDCADRALSIAGRRGECGFEAWALRLLGDVARRQDGPGGTTATMHYRKAMARACDLGMRPLAAHCSLELGKQLGSVGQLGLAREYLSTATELYRKMNMSIWLKAAETEIEQYAYKANT